MSCFWKRSTVIVGLMATLPLLRASSLQAACVGLEDFTNLYGTNCALDTSNYYTAPDDLSPDPNGLWDCFGNCGTGSEVQVISDPAGGGNQVVQVTGGTFTTTNPDSDDIITRRTLDQSGPCADGTFTIRFRIKAGSGGGATLWRLDFGTNSTKLARLQGTATSVFGRAGGNTVSATANLTGTSTFDTILIRIDTDTNATEYLFDAGSTGSFVSLGVLNHALDGSGNSINQFNISRVNNAGSAGHTVILDDIQIETCRDCQSNVTPKSDQSVSGPVGGAVTPASIVYHIQNYGTQSVTYTVQEVNAAGASTDHTWMGLSSGGGTLANNGDSNNIGATFNTTGLSAGVYTGYIKFTESSCAAPLNTYMRRVNLFVGVPVSCFSESFDALSLGSLNGQGGWSGDATAMDVVSPGNGGSGKAMQLTMGSFTGTTQTHTMTCAPCTDGGIITVTARVKSNGGGGGNAWRMWITSSSGVDFARWQGQAGNCVIGRIGGLNGTATSCTPLSTTSFDELKVVIDTISDTSEFFINDVSISKFSHGADVHPAQANVSNSLGSITFERINRTDVSGTVTIDDVQVISCPISCGVRILPDQTGGSGVGRPVNYGTYSAAVQGDLPDPLEWDFYVTNVSPSPLSYSVVESDINGSPTNHSWIDLDNTGGALGLDESDRVLATLNTTGLTPGEYVGFLKFTDSCSPANTYTLRTLRLVVIAPDTATAGHSCLVDSFSVPNGVLNSQAGWSGNAGTAIQVLNGTVRISASTSGDVNPVGAVTDVPDACVIQADCVNQNSLISVKLKMQAGTGTNNIWQIQFMDESTPQQELGRFYRTGSVVAGRIGNFVTGDANLTAGPGFDELEARINVSDIDTVGGIPPNSTKFYINGLPFPGSPAPCGQTPPPGNVNPICHLGAGDIVTQISVQRTAGTGAPFITLDDVRVDYCVPACNDPVFDVRNQVNAPVPDGFVDLHDLNFGFIPCVTGPTPGPGVFGALSFECQCMDTNGDLAIDINDFAAYQRCYSGNLVAVDPNCDN